MTPLSREAGAPLAARGARAYAGQQPSGASHQGRFAGWGRRGDMYSYVSPVSLRRGRGFLLHKYQGQVNSRKSEKKARPPPHGNHAPHRRPHPGRAEREARRLDRRPAGAEAVAERGDQAVARECFGGRRGDSLLSAHSAPLADGSSDRSATFRGVKDAARQLGEIHVIIIAHRSCTYARRNGYPGTQEHCTTEADARNV